jgi:NADPH-dependent glutamate synthase beta subunit-like oxidoreductase
MDAIRIIKETNALARGLMSRVPAQETQCERSVSTERRENASSRGAELDALRRGDYLGVCKGEAAGAAEKPKPTWKRVAIVGADLRGLNTAV